jgi:hypothetical protein
MVEKKRSFHKQRKWVCPRCGTARMQAGRQRQAKGNRGAEE